MFTLLSFLFRSSFILYSSSRINIGGMGHRWYYCWMSLVGWQGHVVLIGMIMTVSIIGEYLWPVVQRWTVVWYDHNQKLLWGMIMTRGVLDDRSWDKEELLFGMIITKSCYEVWSWPGVFQMIKVDDDFLKKRSV